jgi:hypothetical protein
MKQKNRYDFSARRDWFARHSSAVISHISTANCPET